MASVRIVRWIDLKGIEADIIAAAEEGVEAAVEESVSWVKNDVLIEQKYVGNSNFPDVKQSTKKSKQKKGANKVLIDTGHYKDSWIGETSGLEGKISGGSGVGYAARLHKKWHIDKLWKEAHSKEVFEIIEKSLRRVI